MARRLAALAVFLALAVASSSAAGADGLYANLSNFINTHREELERLGSTTAPAVLPLAFPCQLKQVSASTPDSVHKLRPSDINVVISLGDSITAAFGAESTSILNVFTEYRGVSWSGGGQDTYESKQTMPNILKLFNSKLYGYATGTGGPNSASAVFNIAVSGAVAADVPSQARTLVEKLKSDARVNYEQDWKLVTLWIGGNDLCAACNDPEYYSARNYQAHMQTALDVLLEVPRVFVNLVMIMDITRLHQLQAGLCDFYHSTVCPCVQKSDDTRSVVQRLAGEYQAAVDAIVGNPRYQSDTFAVVAQPFFVDTQIPLAPGGAPDRSFFAPDCFHFSYKAHAAAAIGLWNNMLEPQGSKAKSWDIGQPPKCPTVNQPYLCTPTNQCGASQAVSAHDHTGGQAPPATMTVEQRTMFGLALVLIVAVPTALVAYFWWRRRRAGQSGREGYSALPGETLDVTHASITTAV